MLVPNVLAMVICDAVWRDPTTGKVTLLGVFTEVAGRDLPVELGQLCVYFHLSGYRGTTTVRIELSSAAEGESAVPLASAELNMTFPDRLASRDGAATLYNVDLPTFGEYTCIMWAGDTPIASRRLLVNPLP